MTECTEVSYIVPSYIFLFLRCRRLSEDMEMLYYNFWNEEKHSIIIEHANFLRPYFFCVFN